MTTNSDHLAILGGQPARKRPWPKWPRGTPGGQRNLFDALHSGKWAISGVAERTTSFEARFGNAFATYANRRFGVPCSSGTAALTIALQAMGVGPGSAVVVPGLTWVACASAVLNLGATPVLCDINPDTLCVNPDYLDEALGRVENTHVVQMVHMYGSVCEIDQFVEKSERHSVTILEDGSQAHGGRWRGQPIGSFGQVSAFSLQHSKLLTCGEGGVCATDDPEKYLLLQQYRADARVYSTASGAERRSGCEIEVRGDVVGRNLCLSEFQAGVALDALDHLDRETAHRSAMVDRFADLLADLGHARVTECPAGTSVRPYYRVAVRLDQALVGAAPITLVAATLAKECNADIRPLDIPLDSNPLYRPSLHPIVRTSNSLAKTLAQAAAPLPLAHSAYNTTVTIPHQVFLSSQDDMTDLSCAFAKFMHTAERDANWFTGVPADALGGTALA